MLIFLILSVSLVTAMIGFDVAKDNATGRGVEVRAEAMARSIGDRIVGAATFADEWSPDEGAAFSMNWTWKLEDNIEGYGYRIHLKTDAVNITVRALDTEVTASLYGIDETPGVHICEIDGISGGAVQIRVFTVNATNLPEISGTNCSDAQVNDRVVILREAP